MRKEKRNNSKLLKVVDNTEVSVETKKQQEEDQAYEEFNTSCKELVRGEIRKLFENTKLDKGLAVYNFAFHLTNELIFDNMAIGKFQHALNRGVIESEQNYLDYLKNEYQITPREVVDHEKNKTIN